MIVLATRNLGKVAELRRILTADQLAGHELAGLDAFPDAPEVVETGTTFVENALLKAHAAAAHTGLVAVADDSGLCVDALNAMPGVLSARWSGRHGDERADVALVLAQLADLPAHQRGAGFVCAAVAVTPDGSQRVARGELRGALANQPRGSNGFGYDPIFVPEGERRTTAELSPADKDAISHRGKAFRELAPLLAELL